MASRRSVAGFFFVLVSVASGGRAAASAAIDLTISGQPSGLGELIDSDPVAVSGVLLVAPSNVSVIPGGQVAAAADASTGTVRAMVSAVGIDSFPSGDAGFSDDIVITGPGPTVHVVFGLIVDGHFDASKYTSDASGAIDQLAKGTLSVTYDASGTLTKTAYVAVLHHYAIPNSGDAPVEERTVSGFPSATETTVGPMPAAVVTFGLDLPVDQAISVGVSLAVSTSGSSNFQSLIDYGNTGRLSIELPDGYTYASASGVLLVNAGGDGLPLPKAGESGTHGTPGGLPDLAIVAPPTDAAVVADLGVADALDFAGTPDATDAASSEEPKVTTQGCASGASGLSASPYGLLIVGLGLMRRGRRSR